MKNNLLTFFVFVLSTIFLSAQTNGDIHSTDELKCSISGILCDGITRMPLSNSYIFALSADEQKIIGYTIRNLKIITVIDGSLNMISNFTIENDKAFRFIRNSQKSYYDIKFQNNSTYEFDGLRYKKK